MFSCRKCPKKCFYCQNVIDSPIRLKCDHIMCYSCAQEVKMCAQDNCGKEINEESIIELAADNIEYVFLQLVFGAMVWVRNVRRKHPQILEPETKISTTTIAWNHIQVQHLKDVGTYDSIFAFLYYRKTRLDSFKSLRARMNAFFMHFISEIVFSSDTRPDDHIMQWLLERITKDKSTRQLSLFNYQEVVDPSPVLR